MSKTIPKTTPTALKESFATPPPKQDPIKVQVFLDHTKLQDFIDKTYDDGHRSGFRDGIKYIVTTAENFLVEHNKLGSRKALTDNSLNMPTWWIATLIEALYYEPPYAQKPKAMQKPAEDVYDTANKPSKEGGKDGTRST